MKGQWFLISAVVVSGAFLAISLLLKGYFVIDTTTLVSADEDFCFRNIRDQLNKTIELSTSTDLESNIKEFIYLSEKKMQERGYLLDVMYKIIDLNNKIVEVNITLSSDRMIISSLITY